MNDFWGQLVTNDVFAFNFTMKKYGVDAKIKFDTQQDANMIKVFPESFISYPISVGEKVKFAKVAGLEKEIKSEIASFRIRAGINIEKLSMRFVYNPLFVLEVDSPGGFFIARPERRQKDYQSLIGVKYDAVGRSDMIYDITQHHQLLIAAVSGHGKSYLLETILDGLYGTPPSKLVLDVVDFKNDLKIDRQRIDNYIHSVEEVSDYIYFLCEEKERRKNFQYQKKRLIVIDEAAEFPKELDAELASIMKLGRSIGLNTIIATQHPTADQIGKQIARSFTHRIVGRVENAMAAKWASGTEASGAQNLLRAGSFLFCHGSEISRFQVFYGDGEK